MTVREWAEDYCVQCGVDGDHAPVVVFAVDKIIPVLMSGLWEEDFNSFTSRHEGIFGVLPTYLDKAIANHLYGTLYGTA